MKNFVKPGDVLTVTAPAAVVSGGVVLVGKLLGIAATDAAINEAVEVAMEGVFDVPVASADAIAVGDLLYWNAAGGEFTKTATGNTKAGLAALSAGAGVTAGQIRLTPGVG